MNIDDILRIIQDFRSNLDTWGVTNESLWGAGALAVVLFIFSLREVLSWYLRVQQVRDEVQALRVQVTDMQKMLIDTRELLLRTGSSTDNKEPLTPTEESLKPEVSGLKKFRLDH